MSDDDDSYDDDYDYFYLDDGPVAQADDLAEHTMHSPIYIDFEPSMNPGESLTDWEYLTDDFYDDLPTPTQNHAPPPDANQPTAQQRKRKAPAPLPARRKRRKLTSASATEPQSSPEPLSPTPVVRWKTSAMGPKALPLLSHGVTSSVRVEKKVALLPDWRERLGIHKGWVLSEEESEDGEDKRGEGEGGDLESDGNGDKNSVACKENRVVAPGVGKEKENKRKMGARSPPLAQAPVLAAKMGNQGGGKKRLKT